MHKKTKNADEGLQSRLPDNIPTGLGMRESVLEVLQVF